MIHYCINTIICSGLLFFLYKALLENEKMHVFKRFYLLFAIFLSLTAPLITLPLLPAQGQSPVLQYMSKEPVDFIIEPSATLVKEESNKLLLFLIVIYLAGFAISFLRFVKRVFYFFKVFNNAEQLLFKQARLVLVDKEVIPHSFLNTIFLNKEAYENGLVENEILMHELTHVRQLHSLDVLLTQLVNCFFWFNPFFVYYTKAIQLNHEFLADQEAAHFSNDPLTYQQLLLNKASGNQQLSLASQFNYSIIKKRLVMITQQTSPRISLLKKMTIIPLLAITVFLFAKKETIAQKSEPAKNRTEVPSTTEGVSQDLLKEYEAIVQKHKISKEGNRQIYSPFSEEERERLLSIYKKMSKEQQNKQTVGFIKPRLKEKRQPTQSQLAEWVDAKKYFVRINGYKVKNNQLLNYKASDFDYVEIYKPNKGSTDYGKYDAQINLMTKEVYAKYVKEYDEKVPLIMVGTWHKPKK